MAKNTKQAGPWTQYQKKGPWTQYQNTDKEPAQDEPAPEGPHDFSAVNMVKNIPSSAGKVATDLYEAVRHPVDTAKGIDKLAKSLQWKSADAFGTPIDERYTSEGETGTADMFFKFIKDRYGSIDAAQRTLETDPVGALVDTAGLVSGTGSALKIPGLSKIPGAVPAAAALTRTGAAMNPINVAGNAVKYGAGKVIPEGLPQSLYESAAKFKTTIAPEERKRMVETAIDSELLPNGGGVARLDSLVESVGSKIDELIEQSQSSGVEIPKSVLFSKLGELRKELGGAKIEGGRDLKIIDQVAKQLNVHLEKIGKTTLTPSELQAFKVDTYKRINYNQSSGSRGATYGKQEAYKNVARSAKEKLEDVIPEIGPLNTKQGQLLELRPNLERSANRIDNRNMMSLDTGVKLGTGGVMGSLLGSPEVGFGIAGAASILGTPMSKARLAIMLDKLKKTGDVGTFIRNNPGLSQAELAAIIAARDEEVRPPLRK